MNLHVEVDFIRVFKRWGKRWREERLVIKTNFSSKLETRYFGFSWDFCSLSSLREIFNESLRYDCNVTYLLLEFQWQSHHLRLVLYITLLLFIKMSWRVRLLYFAVSKQLYSFLFVFHRFILTCGRCSLQNAHSWAHVHYSVSSMNKLFFPS